MATTRVPLSEGRSVRPSFASPVTAVAPATGGTPLSKGDRARAEIIRAALDIATHAGLEGITIGGVSESSGRSKSGVFAHFGSREDLQIAVLEAYETQFIDHVLRPALAIDRGLPRLRRIIANWLALVVDEAGGACIWMSAAHEYDDRPGPVRDRVVQMASAWQRHIVTAIRAAQDAGHLSASLDPLDLTTMIHGMTLALHHEVRLLQSDEALRRVQRIVDRMMMDAGARPGKPPTDSGASRTSVRPRSQPAPKRASRQTRRIPGKPG